MKTNPRPDTGPVMATRLKQSRADIRPVTAPAPAPRAGLTWPRLPVAAELATIGAGYAAYSLVRLVIRASRRAAFAHAAWLWQSERRRSSRVPLLTGGRVRPAARRGRPWAWVLAAGVMVTAAPGPDTADCGWVVHVEHL